MNTIFWNTDMQYDFMRYPGLLYVQCAERICKMIEGEK